LRNIFKGWDSNLIKFIRNNHEKAFLLRPVIKLMHSSTSINLLTISNMCVKFVMRSWTWLLLTSSVPVSRKTKWKSWIIGTLRNCFYSMLESAVVEEVIVDSSRLDIKIV
jgi:hypothetical protein